jgi:hypothetical protein
MPKATKPSGTKKRSKAAGRVGLRLTDEQADLLKNVYDAILSTLSAIDIMAGPGFPPVMTHVNVYEHALDSVFDFAVGQGFIPEPPLQIPSYVFDPADLEQEIPGPPQGYQELGIYYVPEKYRAKFFEQVGEFVEWFDVEGELNEDDEIDRWELLVPQEPEGDSKWKTPWPSTIIAKFKAETGNVSDVSIIERMIPANILARVPDIRYSAERKAYYRILREPKFPARLNNHHQTLAEIIRTTVHTPYPALDPIELTWRLR